MALPLRGGDGVPRRVIRPVALRDGPLHHRADPLVHGPRGRGLARPDGLEDSEHVGRRDLAHAFAADTRMGVVPQRLPPLPGHAGWVLPGRRVDRDHLLDGRLEGGDPRVSRVVAPMDCPPVLQRLLSRLPERHDRVRAQSEIGRLPSHSNALAPGLGDAPGLHPVDAEVQAEPAEPAVAVASRRLHPRHEGGRKRSFAHVVNPTCVSHIDGYTMVHHGTNQHKSEPVNTARIRRITL